LKVVKRETGWSVAVASSGQGSFIQKVNENKKERRKKERKKEKSEIQRQAKSKKVQSSKFMFECVFHKNHFSCTVST